MIGKLSRLARCSQGAGAAEFALVLPLLLIFIFGIIDVGRLMWTWNRAEKATQMGVRYAVVTNMVPSGLASYSFATGTQVGAVLQGNPVPSTSWGGVTCTSTACTNKGTGPTPGFDTAAFTAITQRMQAFMPELQASNITIEYDNVGLGYSGDPNGPDVSPLVTVKIAGLSFQPLTLIAFSQAITLPDFRAALTLEDGEGTASN